jgi:hypothetical protein
MPASQAHVRTDRAGRYLAQLCDHSSHLGRMAAQWPRLHGAGDGTGAGNSTGDADAPLAVVHADWSGTEGVIDFGWGRCTLQATDETLTLTAEADNQLNLQRIQEGIARRLAKVGRRDRLSVAWRQTPSETAEYPELP